MLQAAADRRVSKAQALAQTTPAAAVAQELGITPAVTTADALDGGVDFDGIDAVPGSALQGRDVARTAIRGLSGSPTSADQVQQNPTGWSAESSAIMAEWLAGANMAAAEPPATTGISLSVLYSIFHPNIR